MGSRRPDCQASPPESGVDEDELHRGKECGIMKHEREEPLRLVKLGDTRLYIQPDRAGSYLLHRSDGALVATPFTRNDAARFARELLHWVREADSQD
jgi:hypothetical protein